MLADKLASSSASSGHVLLALLDFAFPSGLCAPLMVRNHERVLFSSLSLFSRPRVSELQVQKHSRQTNKQTVKTNAG